MTKLRCSRASRSPSYRRCSRSCAVVPIRCSAGRFALRSELGVGPCFSPRTKFKLVELTLLYSLETFERFQTSHSGLVRHNREMARRHFARCVCVSHWVKGSAPCARGEGDLMDRGRSEHRSKSELKLAKGTGT